MVLRVERFHRLEGYRVVLRRRLRSAAPPSSSSCTYFFCSGTRFSPATKIERTGQLELVSRVVGSYCAHETNTPMAGGGGNEREREREKEGKKRIDKKKEKREAVARVDVLFNVVRETWEAGNFHCLRVAVLPSVKHPIITGPDRHFLRVPYVMIHACFFGIYILPCQWSHPWSR